jgi:hypothetical protein
MRNKTMAHFAGFILLMVLIIQCKGGPRRFADKPKTILPKPEMQAVLTDIHVAEGAAKADSIPRDSSRFYVRAYYRTVLEKHDVSVAKYKRSLEYYVANPDIMVTMYKPLMKDLRSRKKALKKRP